MILAAFSKKPNFPATDHHPHSLECEGAGFVVHYVGEKPTVEEIEDFTGTSERRIRERKVAALKAECGRRILSRYPIHKQINNPDDLEMRGWIDAMRARCNEIEAMPEIPENVREDSLWNVVWELPSFLKDASGNASYEALPDSYEPVAVPEAAPPEMAQELADEPFAMPSMFKRDAGQQAPSTRPEPPPAIEPIDQQLLGDMLEAAVASAIDRITAVATAAEAALRAREETVTAKEAAVAHLMKMQVPPAQIIREPVVTNIIRDDGRNEQVIYETALRARNGDVEAKELLRPAADAFVTTVAELSDRIIENRKQLERTILAQFAQGGQSWSL